MKGFWRQYWIIYNCNSFAIQIINNWHEFNTEKWHLISFYRQFLNGKFDYYIGFFGFIIRFINYNR